MLFSFIEKEKIVEIRALFFFNFIWNKIEEKVKKV